MSGYILGRFRVDLAKWLEMLERDRLAHKAAGLRFDRAWRNADDRGEIFFLFEVNDLKTARAFLEKAGALDKEKAASGKIPQLTFLEAA